MSKTACTMSIHGIGTTTSNLLHAVNGRNEFEHSTVLMTYK